MTITRKILFRGCLIASISHAIMTNVYPDLSYEQSWDQKNYSIQVTEGLRGTITFENDCCVGAIRNEASGLIRDWKFAEKIASDFPLKIIEIARKETWQYLLVEDAGRIIPSITSMFWADDEVFQYNENNISNLQEDLVLFRRNLLPEEDAINEWREYYDMDENAIRLVKCLLNEKANAIDSKIILSSEQKNLYLAK